MLAHSPPIPLTVDYGSDDGITDEDEEGILLALGQRHRVRHLHFWLPVQNVRKLVMAIDGEFPILEYLIMEALAEGRTALTLPETLQDASSSTPSTSTSPHAGRLRLSNSTSITPDCPGPCHTQSHNKTPTRLLSNIYTAAMDFVYAPTRGPRNLLYIPCSQP